ncbi:hypothetical protein GYMLUDRAFT_1024413 [Collybiopsis luxurians FD-317 M1]|uniref:Uncharacterized protein n=1 Tax=Collybiopsis luxurians FD-317 M1 TaxID=944289 RepID=A0A0D0BWL6_9AGAR|nr:hypothetical protein GYMLUDRAFT_1024413 [Collybiopsis luxurians FD-317 M1]
MQTELEPRFPLEIFEHFIDESSDSTDDLRVLALVAKAWNRHARKYLFRLFPVRQLTAKKSMFSNEKEEFQKFLLLNSSISDCIKGLRIERQSLEGTVFPPNRCYFLHHRMIWGGTPAFSRLLQSGKPSGFEKIFLEVENLVEHSSGDVVNPLEYLATYAPSLETLGILASTLVWVQQYHPHLHRTLLESTLDPRNRTKSIGLKQLYLRLRPLHASPNRTLEILLFESGYLNYSNLVHLAIDSTSIALLIGRSGVFEKVKHLTLFNRECASFRFQLASEYYSDTGWIVDYLPDVWAYNKAQIRFPSLTSLELVIDRYCSVFSLCRVILGPSEVTCRLSRGVEYPGSQYYTPFTKEARPDPSFTYPRVENLHIDFRFSTGKAILIPDAELALRMDRTLVSYLDGNGGPLRSIMVSDVVIYQNLPRTASSGRLRLREGKAQYWWDTAYW